MIGCDDVYLKFLEYLVNSKLVTHSQFLLLKKKLVTCELTEILLIEHILSYRALQISLAHFLGFEFLKFEPQELIIANTHPINQYCKEEYLLCFNNDQLLLILTTFSLTRILALQKSYPKSLPLLTDKVTFFAIIEYHYREVYSLKAIEHLGTLDPRATAKNLNFTKINIYILSTFLLIAVMLTKVFYVSVNIVFYLQNIFKTYLFFAGRSHQTIQFTNKKLQLQLHALPIYTILVPLYQDHGKLREILSAIDDLEYPKSKLDVKIIIEEDDLLTIKEIYATSLPYYIHVVKTPYSLPRTKPKALNYASYYCRGEYLVIYDAEDLPDRHQLLVALEAFNNAPLEYACMQARLNFYNFHENFLTLFMSVEYSLWFDSLFKGLDVSNLPITLGGTSNHFKVSALQSIGLWDAFNVTEDADLGIRMYLYGYKTKIINSFTLEEAPIEIFNWLAQRSRWIKGFFQTFLIYYFQAPQLKSSLSFLQRATIWFLVGVPSYTFILAPLLILCTPFINNVKLQYFSFINLIFIVPFTFIINISFIYSNPNSRAQISLRRFFILLTLWPFYFVLHTIASYRALYEIFTTPFTWNKTKHGVSKVSSTYHRK